MDAQQKLVLGAVESGDYLLRAAVPTSAEIYAHQVGRLQAALGIAKIALLQVASYAHLELTSPTGMEATAFSLIEKNAREALDKLANAEAPLNLEEPRG